jgi:hypothetical protein
MPFQYPESDPTKGWLFQLVAKSSFVRVCKANSGSWQEVALVYPHC